MRFPSHVLTCPGRFVHFVPLHSYWLEVKARFYEWRLVSSCVSALVGFAVMMASSPLPGYLTSLMRGFQTAAIKKVSCPPVLHEIFTYVFFRPMPVCRRLSKVSRLTDSSVRIWPRQAMSILRMVKLFGWEPKIREEIVNKRKEELILARRSKILNLVTVNVKWVPCCL